MVLELDGEQLETNSTAIELFILVAGEGESLRHSMCGAIMFSSYYYSVYTLSDCVTLLD